MSRVMDRAKRRRLMSFFCVAAGVLLLGLFFIHPFGTPDLKWFLFGVFFVVYGLLALLGVNVWKGGWLDPRWDRGGPAPPPEVMRTERLSEDPFRPGQRWLPMDFATFPRRCVGCGQPPVGVWKIQLARGADLLVFAFHQVNWVEAPVCAECRRQRRLASFLLFTSILWPWLLLFFLDQGLHAIRITTPWIIAALAWTLLAAGFIRTWGPPLLDRALLGVSGVALEKGGRSGWIRFKNRELADEVVALTRARMHAAESLPRDLKMPAYIGTT